MERWISSTWTPDSSLEKVEGAIVPLPFACPPRPYAQGDVPFSWEARYEAPDRWGKHGTR